MGIMENSEWEWTMQVSVRCISFCLFSPRFFFFHYTSFWSAYCSVSVLFVLSFRASVIQWLFQFCLWRCFYYFGSMTFQLLYIFPHRFFLIFNFLRCQNNHPCFTSFSHYTLQNRIMQKPNSNDQKKRSRSFSLFCISQYRIFFPHIGQKLICSVPMSYPQHIVIPSS